MFKVSLLIFVCLTLVCCSDEGSLNNASVLSEYQERTVTVDGKERKYRVFVPIGREEHSNVKLPVMLYLHGSGSRGDDNKEPAYSFASAIDAVKDKINFIVVLPQCRDDDFWASSEMAKYSIAALDQAVKEFNGDEERLYLGGFSLGGYGTWQIGAGYPGKFAALVPIAGGVVGERPIRPEDRAAIIPEVGKMLDSAEPYKALATAIGSTPVWVFHGAKDEAVPVDFSRTIVAALREQGNTKVKYTEYENDGHMIFAKAFSEPGFLEWLSVQRLEPKK